MPDSLQSHFGVGSLGVAEGPRGEASAESAHDPLSRAEGGDGARAKRRRGARPSPGDGLLALARLQREYHPQCAVCSPGNAAGLGLRFSLLEGGAVEAPIRCDERFQGYRSWVHGGAISAVLDGAMTNCLFAAGIVAVTAELKIRFRRPVRTGTAATVRAWPTRALGPMHLVRAEIRQHGRVAASATGKFMEHTPEPWRATDSDWVGKPGPLVHDETGG